jgi:3-oxoacyl-[acyl-carrier protein] reductase
MNEASRPWANGSLKTTGEGSDATCSIVLGASLGMGMAIALELSSFFKNTPLILIGRDQVRLQKAKDQCLSLGASTVVTVSMNLNTLDFSPICQVLEEQNWKWRRLLLNTDGFSGESALGLSRTQMEEAHLNQLLSPILLTQTLLPWVASPASLLALTSTTTLEPNPYLPLSGMYRTALWSWLKSISRELGPSAIRVNALAPGYVATPKLAELQAQVALKEHGSTEGWAMDKVAQRWSEMAPLGRLASPQEIAKTARFLLSDDASFLTGQQVVADGGQIKCL